MEHITEQEKLTRWYPLSYPGYYDKELNECPSLSHEHCRVDVSFFRGERIFLHMVSEADRPCSLVDADGTLLTQWEAAAEKILIPENALYLYLNNNYAKNPDFYLSLPEEKRKKQNGLLFYEDFTYGSFLDGNDFYGNFDTEKCTPKGLILPKGIENSLVIHKSTALDNWSLTAEVTAPDGNETIFLGTRITQDRPCKHATLCCVDLAEKEFRLYRSSTGVEMPAEILQRASLDGFISKGEFTVRLERINVAIRASVINQATGKALSITQELMQEENPPASIAGACRAGKMFDSPQIFATAGSPLLRRIYGSAKVHPKVIFFGDSITQGAHNLPEKGWAQMCAAKIGNSLCCGRGSGDIWSCLNQVRTMLPALHPKAIVVTIGANNRGNTVSLDTVKNLYEKFIFMAEYYGVIPIINCISTSLREHVEPTNQILRSLGVLKSRFDLALRENNDLSGKQLLDVYYVSDQSHLNEAGNLELYRRFMTDFSWLCDL